MVHLHLMIVHEDHIHQALPELLVRQLGQVGGLCDIDNLVETGEEEKLSCYHAFADVFDVRGVKFDKFIKRSHLLEKSHYLAMELINF